MTIQKGANVALTQEIPDLRSVVLGIRWDAGNEPQLDANLVVATLLCDEQGHVLSEEHVVFLNQLVSPDLSVGQLERARGKDREQIEVDLLDVPAEVNRLAVVIYLNEGAKAPRTLGQLKSCKVRVLNLDGDAELLVSTELATGLTTETALVLGELYRHRSGWKFRVIGQGYATGLKGIARDYGLSL